ncbi:MAG: type II toxin-antitoxin system VapC family toxin [Melioribacteraceae bacterium]|nr:type II toxin-antitoxin system VapC family toxin [Melioribacteraceae bacterium]MCF8353811.1 type II toxin-antitoxin system VapC family toxin [Melioribacteraceae bacterium]MCF8393647.1 type II toxin-antitoxin system VapC family toxin [Melioribacteraceae bacterium]MCF8419457.1 type II toxin-antitoxin system VapC family toxin [Melioribacteraceae bacterium]
MKQSVYVETTIVSYLTAKLSRDIVVAAHQQITQEWWENVRPKFDIFISPFVIQESERGDKVASLKRMELLSQINVLELNIEIEKLAKKYFDVLPIPNKAQLDAAHLAVACYHKMDYLISWNCKHIVSARIRKDLEKFNKEMNLITPTICTPEELMEI